MRLVIRRNKVRFIAIYEHRIRDDRISKIINKTILGWEWNTNADGITRGRIWIAWDTAKVKFESKETSAQHIHGLLILI